MRQTFGEFIHTFLHFLGPHAALEQREDKIGRVRTTNIAVVHRPSLSSAVLHFHVIYFKANEDLVSEG